MSQTFKKRAAEIADHAHNVRGTLGEGVDFLRGLDETERQREWDELEGFEKHSCSRMEQSFEQHTITQRRQRLGRLI